MDDFDQGLTDVAAFCWRGGKGNAGRAEFVLRARDALAKMTSALRLAIEELEFDEKYGITIEGEDRVVDQALRVCREALESARREKPCQ